MSNLFYWICLFSAVLISSISRIFLKKAANREYKNIVREYLNPYVILGYGLLFGSTILMIFSYKGVAFKNGPVIEALGFVLVVIWGKIFLKEKITIRKLIGNLVIIFGIIIFYL